MKAISDKRFWEIVDYYEANENVIDTLACDLIGIEYQNARCEDYDEACADVDLLLKGMATQEHFDYLRKNYF